ncbi:MAG TPA: helix-turn-helix domain-containing protein [Terriglobales bacterium]|nr:helix-turn-helix domain-containing protein [Terriglobales bacterium]
MEKADALADMLKAFSDLVADAVVEKLRQQDAPRLLNVREAARYLKRSERWLRQEVAVGRIACVREGKGRPRFDRAVLDRWIETRHGG